MEEDRFEPYTPARRKPPADDVGLSKRFAGETAGWFEVQARGGTAYSNGHLLDLTPPPYPHLDRYGSRHRERVSDRLSAERVIPPLVTLELKPVGVYVPGIKRNKPAVIFELATGNSTRTVCIQKSYVDYFTAKYPGARFLVPPRYRPPDPADPRSADGLATTVAVYQGPELRGVVMPIALFVSAKDARQALAPAPQKRKPRVSARGS